MYRRDPILSSSPPIEGDEPASEFVTQPTQPLLNETRSPFFAAPTGTQPTLILTPRTNRMYHPSQVQVTRSSPIGDRSSPAMSQSQGPRVNPMAPPGTYMLLPQPVTRPKPIDLTSDDPPVNHDSDDDGTWVGSNIAPSIMEAQSGTSRVEETPKKPQFDLSSFSYNVRTALPRKRPAETTAYGSAPADKKPRPMPRQTGPSRAMPIDLTEEEPLRIEDILDFDLQRKVRRLQTIYSTKTVDELYQALIRKKGHYDDACDYLAELSEDELLRSPPRTTLKRSPEPVVQPKKTAQVFLSKPKQNLADKYSKLHQTQKSPTTPTSPDQPRKNRRLVRGRRNRSPSPLPTPPRPQQKKVLPDEEDEAIVLSDSNSEAVSSEEDTFDAGNLLEFFNTCDASAMVDLSGHKEEDIRAVLAQRPFKSLAAVEKIHVDSRQLDKGKKARKPKFTFGERLVEAARGMWEAYETIDRVVKSCEMRGRPMVNAMARWGVDIFGSSTDGEVALTNLDDRSDTGSNRDSGYQSPRSSNGSDSDRENLRKVVHRPSLSKQKLLKKPAIMNDDIELKDYQLVGLNWLNLMWKNGLSGILADDMGLGKTCQVIAFLSHLKESGVPGPHIVIVPGSTLENWAREFAHFSSQINIEMYYGAMNERLARHDAIGAGIDAGEIDVVLTTYDLAYKKEDNQFLRKLRPQLCVYDEGHVLRNSSTQRYTSLMKIKAECRLLLTGTPLQNSLQELVSILAFLMPDIFGAEDVRDGVAVVFKHKAKVSQSDTHGTLLSTQRINRARTMMTPFVLRRKKAQVLKHLPTKTCRVEYCELTKTQKKLYDEQIGRQRQILLDRAAGLNPKEQTNVMMKLRQAAIHPLLFRERYDDKKIRKISEACLEDETLRDRDPDTIFMELESYQDYQCHQLALKYPKALGKFKLQKQEWMDSGKVLKLIELLKKFKANGDRTLVFSQFTSVMDILQWVLDDEDISYFRLDGQTPISERQQMLDEFYRNESIPVFMLSTKSGGAGINLACANKVIIFDSSFNPQDDIQAENRAHRVGQTREVEVVRLVTKGTVEEQIHALGISKMEMDKMVSGEEGAEKATKKKKDGDDMSAAEEMGLEAVEKMLMAQMENDKKPDVKEQFMEGLKKRGLDMSAA